MDNWHFGNIIFEGFREGEAFSAIGCGYSISFYADPTADS